MKRFPANWELSGARATKVSKLLVEHSVADTQPVADNATEEGRALNRRIEIALQPNLHE